MNGSLIRSVVSLVVELNITHYEFFGLRDANSAVDQIFYQFGIIRDDYTPIRSTTSSRD